MQRIEDLIWGGAPLPDEHETHLNKDTEGRLVAHRGNRPSKSSIYVLNDNCINEYTSLHQNRFCDIPHLLASASHDYCDWSAKCTTQGLVKITNNLHSEFVMYFSAHQIVKFIRHLHLDCTTGRDISHHFMARGKVTATMGGTGGEQLFDNLVFVSGYANDVVGFGHLFSFNVQLLLAELERPFFTEEYTPNKRVRLY